MPRTLRTIRAREPRRMGGNLRTAVTISTQWAHEDDSLPRHPRAFAGQPARMSGGKIRQKFEACQSARSCVLRWSRWLLWSCLLTRVESNMLSTHVCRRVFGRQAVRDEAGLTAEALSRTHQHTHDAKHTHVAKHRQQHQKRPTRPQTTSQRARPAAAARHAHYLWQWRNSALPLAVAKRNHTNGRTATTVPIQEDNKSSRSK